MLFHVSRTTIASAFRTSCHCVHPSTKQLFI